GKELEVMGMMVHNGRLFAGTLPLAEVYSYDRKETWTRLTQLDTTPDVRYRRVWTMTEYQGRLYCSTLPSGKIFAHEQGKNVSHDHALGKGWHHVVAIREKNRLKLYVSGKLVAHSDPFVPAATNTDAKLALHIGFGVNG